MFTVLYRWRIKLGLEKQFIENWSARTAYLREKYDSLGSRLHQGNDGIFYSYAQWKSAEQREQAFLSESGKTSDVQARMREAVEEDFPEIILETVSDFLILPK
jgi:heme-degrading monooxygenase HmoA